MYGVTAPFGLLTGGETVNLLKPPGVPIEDWDMTPLDEGEELTCEGFTEP